MPVPALGELPSPSLSDCCAAPSSVARQLSPFGQWTSLLGDQSDAEKNDGRSEVGSDLGRSATVTLSVQGEGQSKKELLEVNPRGHLAATGIALLEQEWLEPKLRRTP
ncbi:unnamed protein product [Prorocentrum cordatum]|uniref:Uncharacterized protein n=1 Tax=Prorocentrum cordatum TaxID=2364126 RepID=A0ABN9S567_9DINO|nr:unnamed protein product [Polarella glacialis]